MQITEFQELDPASQQGVLHDIAVWIIAAASRKGIKIVCAESLTGGLVAATLVGVPGASEVFLGGVVAYDLQIKSQVLRVDARLLQDFGAVNPEVALQMAKGAVSVLVSGINQQVYAVATTGVAGPAADAISGERPGVFYVATCDRVERYHARGDRLQMRYAAVFAALQLLEDALLS